MRLNTLKNICEHLDKRAENFFEREASCSCMDQESKCVAGEEVLELDLQRLGLKRRGEMQLNPHQAAFVRVFF
jgi:hypothetical protein